MDGSGWKETCILRREPEKDTSATLMRGPKATILVVDDEPNVLLTVQAILQTEGYETEGVADGAKAIEVVRQRQFDLVLTDLKMPGVDGLGVLAEVQRSAPSTVTVMMTGYGSVDSAIDAIRLGAYEYLLKPVDVPELKAAVVRALERKRFSEIDTLYRLGQVLSSANEVGEISRQVCESVKRFLGVEHAQLVMLDRSGPVPEYRPLMLVSKQENLSSVLSYPTMVDRLSRGEVITDQNCPEKVRDWSRESGIESFAFQPGIAAGSLVCVLEAHNGGSPYEFHASALRFLGGVASIAASSIQNALLIAELTKNNREVAAANEKLRDLDKLKSQFLASATHELRTPLTVLLGYNTMLAESLEDRLTEEERKTLAASVSACRRLIRLIDSMLDISQIESGKMAMKFSSTDVGSIIVDVAALFRYEAAKKRIGLQTLVPKNLPRVPADAEKIQQVLINLLANALKFTDSKGSITIEARHEKRSGNLEISVCDTGPGIAPEHHEAIFQEFFRVDDDGNGSGKGAGLGLAIAKRILQAHRGEIHLESEPGKGSKFVIKIPIRAIPTISTAVPA